MFLASCANNCSFNLHQIPIIAVRLIKLQHRELGIVLRADPFIAEIAVDLIHAVEATDHQPLQIQLRRNA